MPNNITHKTSTNASAVPTISQLGDGELAINAAAGKVYTKKVDGSVVDLTDVQLLDGGAQFTPLDISNAALWLDASDTNSLYTTDSGAVTAVAAPTDIAGCKLWLDADDASTFTLVSNAVSEWRDKSNSGVPHATQSSSSFRPVRTLNSLNSRAAVLFQTSHFLSFINSTASFNFLHNSVGGTIFIVIKPFSSTDPNAFAYVLNNSNNSSASTGLGLSFDDRVSNGRNNAFLVNVNRGASGVLTSSNTLNNFLVVADAYALVSVVLNNANATAANRAAYFLDGVASAGVNTQLNAPATTNASTDMTIGVIGTPTADVGGINGGVAEIIFYEGALSASNRARVEKYLAAKWGLPDAHKVITQELAPVASPLALSDCALWLDADQSVTASFFDATTGGNAVTTHNSTIARWADKSGNNRHATQATTANQPLLQLAGFNSKTCVRSDGTRWFVAQNTNINSRAVTVFAVYRINTWETATARPQNLYHTNFGDPAYSTNNGIRSEQYNNGMDVRIGPSSGSGSSLAFSNFTSTEQGQTRIQAARVLAAGQTIARVSGVQRASGTVSAAIMPTGFGSNVALFTGFSQDTARILVGDIAEFIIYGRALTDSELQRVERYLALKWNITDAALPTPPVGYWADKSGNNRHATQATGANRPALTATTTNTRSTLSWNGSTSRLRTSTSAGMSQTMSLFAVVKRGATTWGGGGGGGYGTILGAGTSNQGPALMIDNGVLWLNGGTNKSIFTPSGSLGVTALAVFSGTLTSGTTALYVNGALADADPLTGTGTDAGGIEIGAYNPSTLGGGPLQADIAELITYSRVLTPTERRRVEQYLATKWALNIVPQVTNLDAQDWLNRVYIAGGAVSPGTAAAVNNFCNSIDAAGIRDRFYRLNLFCGNDLTTCLVPVYRGPSLGGTQFGNVTDTNNNFTASDYVETGFGSGLTGNGTSKFLNTGMSVNDMGVASSGHLSAYHGLATSTNVNRYYLGANDADAFNRFYLGSDIFSTASVLGIYGGTGSASQTMASQTAGAAGHRILSRTSSSSLTQYHNGAVVATNTTTITPAVSTAAFAVFAANRNGTVDRWHNSWMTAYSIGLGMTAAQATAYNVAMQTFQAALSRAVT